MATNPGNDTQSTASHDSHSGSDLSATVFDQNSRRTTLVGAVASPPSTAQEDNSEPNSNGGGELSSVSEIHDNHIEILDQPIDGWPKFADFITKTPEFAAFSRFTDLNIKSLLYYQAQLFAIRKKLHEQEYRDLRGGFRTERFAKRADFLMAHEESEQCQLVFTMRKVLKEYNEALLQYSQVSALPEPEAYDMKNLRRWVRHPDYGNWCIEGDYKEETTWGDIYEDPDGNPPSLWKLFGRMVWTFFWLQPPPKEEGLDLVATQQYPPVDGFTRWITGYWVPFVKAWKARGQERRNDTDEENSVESTERPQNSNCCMAWPTKRCIPQCKDKMEKAKQGAQAISRRFLDPKNWLPPVQKVEPIRHWSEKGIIRFTSGVSTVVACLLPVAAITMLAQIHGTRNLLLCIAGFAVIFSVLLIFLTHGISTRVDIFTATAAFSAVLVVFISDRSCPLPPTTVAS